ncbi:hypothetical protein ABPG77_000863 [Micractinium sp. CCAP 211/92]
MKAGSSCCALALLITVLLTSGVHDAAGQPAPLAEGLQNAAPLGTATPSAAAAAAAAATSAAAPATSDPASPPAEPAKFSLIVVFRDVKSLAALRTICTPSQVLFRLFYRGLGLPADCHMPGMCRRIYSSTIIGFAGDFTAADLSRLERCLPGAIFYKEPDGKVYKAEDSPVRHAAGPQPSGGHQPGAPQAAVWRSLRASSSVQDVPKVQSFEERQRTPASEGGLWNPQAISQGANISLPGIKRQTVDTRLWNLDRLDQRDLPLDGAYTYGSATAAGTGRGATIYVVDSGVRVSHQEFRTQDGSRTRASHGYDFVEDDYVADDCDGHGTHVAGTAVGLQVGVAKEAQVVAVRILDCTGSGTISNTVAGLDWVAANHKDPAVVTLSLGIQVGSWSRVLEDAVRSLVNDHGVTVVVASGNSGVDACYVAPANVPEVLTVAASNIPTKANGTKAGDPEEMYKWSNTGPCLDIFAPGVDIYSACGGPSRCEAVTDSAYTYASGTSMAVPHVAGVAAIYLGNNPGAAPRDVSAAIVGGSTPDKIQAAKFKAGTPNRLLYSGVAQQPEVEAAGGPPAGPPASG